MEPYLDKNSNVRFFHQQPKYYNIGDDLCSPKHYFNFSAPHKVNIFGGGVENSFYMPFIKKMGLDPQLSIIWGVGQSIKNHHSPKFINELPFRFWRLRDIDSVDNSHFLPCVSCLHPMLNSIANNTNQLIFINFDPNITTDHVKNTIQQRHNNINIIYNNCSDEMFKIALENSHHIITNSFHGAYWGLLSGREVSLIGYSTKFTSLLKIFQLDLNKIIQVDRGCEESLLKALDIAILGKNKQKLENSNFFLQKFRNMNINFANELVNSKLFKKIELKNLV